MEYNIRIIETAQTDMRNIWQYIAVELQNPTAAELRISLLDAAIRSLKEYPARFPLVHDDYLAYKGYRVIVVKSHLVFFIIRDDDETVSVLRVLYGRRDWLRILKDG
ncbi:MAG: type II toxin-antitoxin system RelE/ParE family toxin [Clostridiales bacterium]|jgi:plasmid stabilization system protein ParE|nr:type II toxin-antitoxin system RelE/ParE family toxin [Clostridiales bacterium]